MLQMKTIKNITTQILTNLPDILSDISNTKFKFKQWDWTSINYVRQTLFIGPEIRLLSRQNAAFVIGHEIAHFIFYKRHRKYNNWAEEFKADKLGLKLAKIAGFHPTRPLHYIEIITKKILGNYRYFISAFRLYNHPPTWMRELLLLLRR